MTSRKEKIASDLDRQFAEMGFAEQGVEALRAGADVSLRTLYKYFPSREAMVVGALEYRDKAYFDWLAGGPESGVDHVLHPIVRLGDWLREVANTGCLFLNALAEHPDSAPIRDVVLDHKERLADEFRIRLQTIAPDKDIDQLAETLFLLHEGMTQTARLHGRDRATAAALRAAKAALAAEGIA
ncbi:TetR/AcrR family transcriptional regulator [Rhizobium sp. LEGMi198b]|uniref:TetR/AcrR family transcriptional regulator n=1 Tax=unclassified Rhizobium TaxID=2613769 RepID=UPI0021A87757|nr:MULTISPECIES: TetR/AcrR family transcriptional regulator [Rhizobium]UWU24291.1 TetR/AcrR family transcriptional regulator [Rhizobium tropici]WFU05275.1 TetR/AcrR family transcriptional regulator [Rhizobium sp. CB3171]